MSLAPHTPPTRPIATGVLLVLALFLCGAWITARSYADVHAMVAQELELRHLSGRLLYLQQELTNSARLAAATGNPAWLERHRSIEPHFDTALRRVVELAPGRAVMDSPTWLARAGLANTEARALELVQGGQRAPALALLTDADYESGQQAYVESLESMAAAILDQGRERLAAERLLVLTAAVLGLGLLAALAAAWAWISRLVQQYLHAVRSAELELADINRGLEDRVTQRTAELSAANERLRAEMEHRSKVESELRQAQKLEAVGRLAAGVAHEINTPVQFVNDSCHFLRDGVAGALALQARYQGALDELATGRLDLTQARTQLAQARRAADADFYAAEMPAAANRAIEGLERIAQIVRSMKELSHPDGGKRTRIDLNRAIGSTLALAHNEYKYVAELHTEFGELPPVYGFAVELNQALLNLVVNAAHAVGDAVRGSGRRGNIVVRTRHEGDEVVIEVQDDGCGIPEAIRERIFEPFFTTKAVGLGTGQGLAIARTVIVDKHKGRLSVASQPGQGSTFTIRIPVDGRAQAQAAAA